MQKIFKKILIALLAATAISGQLHAIKPEKKQNVKEPFKFTAEKVSLLDQIADYAYIIADTSDKSMSIAAKNNLQKVMKKLDPQIYNELSDDYNAILSNHLRNHTKVVEAYHRLMDKIKALKADAYIAQTAQDAATAINAVSDELKPAVIAEQAQKVQEAEEKAKQQGYLSRLKSHVFGDEVSWTKAAFYTAVGSAAIVGLYYGYQHNAEIGKAWQGLWKHKEVPLSDNQIKSIIGTSDPILISLARDMMPLKELFLAFDAAHKNFEANPTTAKVLALNTIGTSLVSAISNIQNEKPEYQKINTEQVDAVIEKIMKDWGIEK
jgi:hypothetical protein